jgi:hypothetical protein
MNSPENNSRREFLKQAISSVAAVPTYGFLLNKIKFDTPDTPDYEETVEFAFDVIEREAEMETGMDGSVSNIKANLKRLGLQIELYNKGVAKCSKGDILASLGDDYYCAQQTPGAEEVMTAINKMIKQVKNLN